jgi:hypothetical protein
MCRVWCAIAVFAAAAGCTARSDRPAVETIARSLAPTAPLEGICLESVLLERPVGDRFLDRDLWADALPVGSHEVRFLLSENGLRAGVLSSPPPQRFLAMFESETEAINARRLVSRKDEVLPTSGPHERCAFDLLADAAGARSAAAFNQARCGVLVRTEVADQARVKVTCEPRIQYGERHEWLRPSADGTGFVKYEEVPLAPYPFLAFDAPLGPNEYLLIGWRADRPNTLGEALFAVEANGVRQRVLVIRARQLNPGAAPDLPPLGPIRRQAIAAEAGRPPR